jgi:spermidine/putrescine ABC transporter ATP-binding subunit
MAGPSSPEADGALAFERVDKAYGAATAVRDLTLCVRRGELLTLLGPSGCGKTTTLMMAAGFVTPDHGRILLRGHDVTRTPPQRRNIGVVFQSYALFPHRTVAENIAFPLRMRGLSRTEHQRRTLEALDLVRLRGYESRYPRQLSGGQQQRVALARALVFNPPLLLMDEPLGALDKSLRTAMQFELRQILERLKITVLYVTHDQEEALTLSDRIAVMREGRIEQTGDPEVIYARPANVFVASFVGETNLLYGTVVASPPARLRLDSGRLVPVPTDARAVSGRRYAMALRPEQVGVRPVEDGSASGDSPSEVSAPATVVGAAYLGDAWLYTLTLADGASIRAKRPVDHRTGHFPPGMTVQAYWNPGDTLLLDA